MRLHLTPEQLPCLVRRIAHRTLHRLLLRSAPNVAARKKQGLSWHVFLSDVASVGTVWPKLVKVWSVVTNVGQLLVSVCQSGPSFGQFRPIGGRGSSVGASV